MPDWKQKLSQLKQQLNTRRELVYGTVAVLVVFMLLATFWIRPRDYVDIRDVKLIANAGGSLRQRPFVESIEALTVNYDMGVRIFQLGLGWKDDQLVCRRDLAAGWKRIPADLRATIPIMTDGKPGPDRPCTFDALADWLEEHGDAQLVLDIPERMDEALTQISTRVKNAPKRMIVQINAPEQYETLKKNTFKRVLWFVRSDQFTSDDVINAIGDLKVEAVALPMTMIDYELVSILKRHYKTATYSYVINGCENLQYLAHDGVTGVYTDAIWPGSCTNEMTDGRFKMPPK